MDQPKFAPGFRISMRDILAIVLGAVATASMAPVDRWLSLSIAFVTLHFFLFCNVFRIPRLPELIWAAVFLSLAASAIFFSAITWPLVYLLSAAVTLVLVPWEMRRPSYHGVGWRLFNPRLPDWWRTSRGG